MSYKSIAKSQET